MKIIKVRRNPERWLAIVSTDTSLTPVRICRIYTKRWAIKVFFKQAKQQLGLACEFQMCSYASQVAHTSLVFLRCWNITGGSAAKSEPFRAYSMLIYANYKCWLSMRVFN